MRVLVRPAAATLLLLALASSACASARAPAREARTPLAEAVSRLVVARDRSEELRRRLGDVAAVTQAEVARGHEPSAESLGQLREVKREYVRLRAELFALALLHASAVVE